jgi:hypothetical protein
MYSTHRNFSNIYEVPRGSAPGRSLKFKHVSPPTNYVIKPAHTPPKDYDVRFRHTNKLLEQFRSGKPSRPGVADSGRTSRGEEEWRLTHQSKSNTTKATSSPFGPSATDKLTKPTGYHPKPPANPTHTTPPNPTHPKPPTKPTNTPPKPTHTKPSGHVPAKPTHTPAKPTNTPPKPTHTYDKAGYDADGYDRDGYDRDGLNKNGENREGFVPLPTEPTKSPHENKGGSVPPEPTESPHENKFEKKSTKSTQSKDENKDQSLNHATELVEDDKTNSSILEREKITFEDLSKEFDPNETSDQVDIVRQAHAAYIRGLSRFNTSF